MCLVSVIRQRISLATLGFILGLGIVGSMATLSYRQLASRDDSERWVTHTHDVLETAQALVIALTDTARARRVFATTRNDADLEPYRGALDRVATARRDVRRLTADNPTQQARLDHIDQVISARLAQLDAAIRGDRDHAFDAEAEAALTSAGLALTTRLGALVAELGDAERRLLELRTSAMRAEAESARRIIAVGFSTSIALVLAGFLLSRREVSRRRRSEQALAEREQHLAATLTSIGDGVIATDATGVITRMNPVAEQLTGWSASDAAGRRFAEVFRIIDEATRDPEPDPAARVLAERVTVGLSNQTLLIARDGTERLIADSAAPILDEHGELRGVVIVFRDVTAGRSVEARFRRLVEAAPDAIVIADPDGRISIVNHQASALFGYAADELVGQSVELLIPERLRERHAGHRRDYHGAPAVRAMGTGLQLLARRKDGTVCPVEVSLSPLHTVEGPQVIAAVRDVTRRRDLERFRDEYVGYISHDLKNPLSVIALQARLLARSLGDRASAEDLRAVGVIAESAAFIDHLVRELLEMAYVESEHLQIHAAAVALAEFLAPVLDRAVPASERARVRLEIARPATVSAEARRIERVIVNFVQNALKYAPPGSPIVVRLAGDDDRAVVSVSDRGPGLAPGESAYVFDKYRRASSAKATEGLGLGLYISRKIIEAHGGEIGVDSAPGQGATFFFRLPRIAAAPTTAAAVAAPAADRLHGLKVLLVDDEVNAVSALIALLGDEGLDVVGATGGDQALALADARPPEVAVIDMQMPGMTGLTLMARLRERNPDLPVVIMSGHMETHAEIAAARDRGGVAYVVKPVDIDELLATIGRLTRPA